MLDRGRLQELTRVSGFSLWQTEKDYLQHVFLLFLSVESKGGFVFKGGTALQKVYGLNRFSLDLDFTSRNSDEEKVVERIARDIEDFGFPAEFSRVEKFRDIGKTLVLRIRGPLFDGSDRSITLLRIEISLRRDLVLEPEVKEVVPIYPDVRPYLLQVMRLEEILAEKVRAIFHRGRASDLYDLWFLARKGVKMDLELVNAKLSYYKMVFSMEEFRRKVMGMENTWLEELKPVVTFIPHFKTVIGDIEVFLR
ncbi:MAG: nucleotidyl transferase AbiEii/AbiGii toxin family protein [Candidatus Brockarchaeota archaeon]|nr:nucleotidyl transferase AbiEii/AbiGii toxin family protein [Candidatus Brockarchaeota archaeon]